MLTLSLRASKNDIVLSIRKVTHTTIDPLRYRRSPTLIFKSIDIEYTTLLLILSNNGRQYI